MGLHHYAHKQKELLQQSSNTNISVIVILSILSEIYSGLFVRPPARLIQ
jgi:hypothetical protein